MAEDVVVRLVLDTSNYTSKANQASKATNGISKSADATGKSANKLTGNLGKLGAALGGAFAAKVVFDFAKSSISAFSNLEESINAVNVSYLEGSDAIHALGENSATQFGLTTTAVNDAAVAMSAFADKIDAADPPGAFKNVLQRATDFASVMNLEVEEALLVFRSGLAGESEPLRKFGIDVSAATVNLVGLEAGLGGANGKLDEGEKVQARYLAIMEQTEKVVGDFANTSEGLANRQKTLSAQWGEMQATIGEELEPAMLRLLDSATKLIPIMGALGTAIAGSLDRFIPLIDLVSFAADQLGVVGKDVEETADQFTEAGKDIVGTNKNIIQSVGEFGSLGRLDDTFGSFFSFVAQSVPQQGAAIVEFFTGAGEAADQAAFRMEVVTNKFGGLADRQDEVNGVLAASVAITGLGTDATGRYNDVLSSAITLAAAQAAAEQERAAGIRSVLAAQAEAASPALRLLRADQGRIAALERLTQLRAATGEEKASVEELTAAELDLVGAQIAVDGAAANLAGRVDESAEAFINTAIQAGLLRDEAEELAQELGLIPTTIDVDLTLRMGGLSVGEVTNLLRGSGGTSGSRNKQSGGAVGAGEPFIVGERGPELFLPNSGGQIVPNGDLGGTTIHIHQPETTDLSSDLAAGLIAGQVTAQVEMLSDF